MEQWLYNCCHFYLCGKNWVVCCLEYLWRLKDTVVKRMWCIFETTIEQEYPRKRRISKDVAKKNVVRYYFHGSEWGTLSVRNDRDLYKVQGILKFCIKLSIFKNSTISSKKPKLFILSCAHLWWDIFLV